MSAEQNEAIVRRIYKEFLDELDPAAADELLADDVVVHGVRAFGEGSGREIVKQGFSAFLSGFAERHTEVEELITGGTGSFRAIPTTSSTSMKSLAFLPLASNSASGA
jgi:hypothetical protein